MSTRIPQWARCDHMNLVPIWFVSSILYIFLCKDCGQFILRDFNKIRGK